MAKRKPKRRKPKERKPVTLPEAWLKTMVREAAKAGLVEAIEHTSNFWNVSDGYKKYIEQQIELQSQALLAAVKTALRTELAQHQKHTRKRRP